jgi:D-tyrosyl-tRNA(Tyr) deacylase
MRTVIQRVTSANVTVDNRRIARIERGLLLLVGIGKGDTVDEMARLARKIMNLRIFSDEKGKMNLNISSIGGEILSVPQFTLYADVRRGNRPGFDGSADPESAEEGWRKFNDALRKNGAQVTEGIFGAHMEVGLVNDGPVTILLDSRA